MGYRGRLDEDLSPTRMARRQASKGESSATHTRRDGSEKSRTAANETGWNWRRRRRKGLSRETRARRDHGTEWGVVRVCIGEDEEALAVSKTAKDLGLGRTAIGRFFTKLRKGEELRHEHAASSKQRREIDAIWGRGGLNLGDLRC